MRYTAEQVIEALEQTDANIYQRYSGRNMFGEECPGFEAETDAEAFSVFVQLAAYDEDLAAKLAAGAKTDSLGRGIIVYWPTITYAKAAETEARG